MQVREEEFESVTAAATRALSFFVDNMQRISVAAQRDHEGEEEEAIDDEVDGADHAVLHV